MTGKPVSKPVDRQWLKSSETDKPVPKPVNHFFSKKSFLKKKSDSLTGLSKTGETSPDQFP
jgi:hypothetical protein